jgi:hypothetical protein
MKRKLFPPGFKPEDFKYVGRPAKDQDDFGSDVGIADMACVSQFGENKAKYYHMGVVTAKGQWFAYFEWGRIFSGKSWENGFRGQDYQFIESTTEEGARAAFKKKCMDKNIKRLEKKVISGKEIYVGKGGKDGYIVQSLATRERGLPDAYSIKDASGLKEAKKSKTKKKSKPKQVFQKQVIDLAMSLVGGTRDYTRAISQAASVNPTIDSIIEVRDHLIPAAMQRLSVVGNDHKKQVKDKDLIDISNHVASLVPRPIPRNASADHRAKLTILSSENILAIQQDLDAFEASLKNEDFSVEKSDRDYVNPFDIFNAEIEWIDLKTTKGRWLKSAFENMSNNRHSYISGKLQIKNIFEVSRPQLDKKFVDSVRNIADKKKQIAHWAKLQPTRRTDLSDISDYVRPSNVFLGIHGTRAVNVQAIISSNLRLPKQLSGVQITGAAFGHGIYFATDWKKSYGYTGYGGAYYGGGGSIKGRGFFMFLCDVIMGDAYLAKQSGSWGKPPDNKDSVVAFGGVTRKFGGHLENDEHIIFDPNYQRIRYIIEGDVR